MNKAWRKTVSTLRQGGAAISHNLKLLGIMLVNRLSWRNYNFELAPLLEQRDAEAERFAQDADAQLANRHLDEFIAAQLRFFRLAPDGSQSPQFHSKRDSIAYLFFMFGAISRLERNFSDRELGSAWRNWRKSRICSAYLPNGATERFIHHYPRLFAFGMQRAFASGCYAIDTRLRYETGRATERDCQRADRELRRILIANLENSEEKTA